MYKRMRQLAGSSAYNTCKKANFLAELQSFENFNEIQFVQNCI